MRKKQPNHRSPFGSLADRALDRRQFLSAAIALGAAGAVTACTTTPRTATRPTGKPDLSGLDNAVRPQDDLFRHVNGKWLRDYTIPPDKAGFASFDALADEAELNLRKIIEDIKDPKHGTDEQKIRDLYDSVMDLDTLEKKDMSELADILAEIDKARTPADLASLMGTMSSIGCAGVVGMGIGPDQKNSTRYIPYLGQAGIGLPDESYYREPGQAETRDKYRVYLQQIATGAHLADPAGVADRVLQIETEIAKGHWDNVRERDSKAKYNPHRWSDLSTLAPGFDWDTWLKAAGGEKDKFTEVIVGEPSYFTSMAALWTATDAAIWRDYLRISVVRGFAPYMMKSIADPNFDFFGKTLQGLEQRPDRWKKAVAVVNSAMGEALGKVYVDRHFPADAKKRAEELVDNLIAAYRNSFEHSPWMTQPTAKAAMEKLAKLNKKIGYPDKWRDYSGLSITRDNLIGNLRASNAFDNKWQLDKLGTPVDRDEWQMTPQTANAYYSQNGNEIVFPAAILQAPFFDRDAEAEVNYGGIGAVIGHEIGHAFDDQGSQYDGDGNLRDWWSEADRAAFDAKTKVLIGQYDGLVPAGLPADKHVNGALTIGENLADLGGLTISLAALKIDAQKNGRAAPNLQDVFLSWGRIWREKQRPEAQMQAMATDPHSPSEFRCNQVVRNVPDFYRAFDVKAGDKEFLAEGDRVSIW